jgi:outer membrane protein assembly factor BamD (BamD/ComL family)
MAGRGQTMRFRDLFIALASLTLIAAPSGLAVQNARVDDAAGRDLAVAEFHRRTGNVVAAKFYYQLVQRRYPGSVQANNATQRLANLAGDSGK